MDQTISKGVPLTLEQMQKANLSALIKLDQICREHHLVYYLTFGTLIGAVRHHGFIPWDDDIDVLMPREDYKKLHELLGDEEKDGFKLCNRGNTLNYTYYITRFCNMRYRFETTMDEEKFDIGSFVDIYPLDYYCNDKEHGISLWKHVNQMNKAYLAYMNPHIGSNFVNHAVARILGFFLHVIKGKDYPSFINREIDQYISSKTTSEDLYMGVPSWTIYFKQYRRDIFSDVTELPFEDYSFFVPQGYDEFLRTTYGDYMKLPPENERQATHYYKMYLREETNP